MTLFVILAAVLLSVQAATVPPVIMHKVTAPIPGNVLAPSKDAEAEVPAVVVEVTKDHKHNPDNPIYSVPVIPSVHPVEIPGIVVVLPDMPVVSTASPMVNEVSKIPAQHVTKQRSVDEEVPEEGSGHVVEVQEVPVVKVEISTVQQEVEVTTGRTLEETTTVQVEEEVTRIVDGDMVTTAIAMFDDDVDLTTIVPDSVDTVTDLVVEELATVMTVQEHSHDHQVPDHEEDVTDLIAQEVATVVAVQEQDHDHEEPVTEAGNNKATTFQDSSDHDHEVPSTEAGNEQANTEHPPQDPSNNDHQVPVTESSNDQDNTEHSSQDSSESGSDQTTSEQSNSEDSSEEVNSSSSSSGEPKDIVVPEILSHPHIKDEVTVPHVPTPPPITEDTRDSSSSSSEEENNNENSSVSQEKEEEEVVRHRRAVPFSDKIKLATAQPKLVTDPKVIANILAKSKTVQLRHRNMRSVVNDAIDQTTPLSVSVPEPVTKAMDATPSVTINPCDLLCTKFEIDPVCASNGLCLHEFPNQCILETYNCKHPKEKFIATRDDRCEMSWLEFCSESDLF